MPEKKKIETHNITFSFPKQGERDPINDISDESFISQVTHNLSGADDLEEALLLLPKLELGSKKEAFLLKSLSDLGFSVNHSIQVS